jgi:hypothetical protein
MIFLSLVMMMMMMMIIVRLDWSGGASSAICNPSDCGKEFRLSCHQFKSWAEVNTPELGLNNCTMPIDSVSLQPSEPIAPTSELNMSLVAKSDPVQPCTLPIC